MKIALGSVVKGFILKSALSEHLKARGFEVVDVGCHDTSRFIKYTSVGERIAHALQSGAAQLAINCCGSGTGASLSAGKFKGVSAVSCESVKSARLIRVVNGANCLCMGEDMVTPELACEMADAFIEAEFCDAPAIDQAVRDFWAEAREEIEAKGPDAAERELEGLN